LASQIGRIWPGEAHPCRRVLRPLATERQSAKIHRVPEKSRRAQSHSDLSRLELARSYVAVQDFPDARAMLKSIPALPIQFSDDPKHKEESAELLQEIKDS